MLGKQNFERCFGVFGEQQWLLCLGTSFAENHPGFHSLLLLLFSYMCFLVLPCTHLLVIIYELPASSVTSTAVIALRSMPAPLRTPYLPPAPPLLSSTSTQLSLNGSRGAASTGSSARNAGIPQYGHRLRYLPRNVDDFGDGGAFPEIHIMQYPLEMGRKDRVRSF